MLFLLKSLDGAHETLRGLKNNITPISEGYTVLNNRVCYAVDYSVTVKVEIVGFNQWGEQGRA